MEDENGNSEELVINRDYFSIKDKIKDISSQDVTSCYNVSTALFSGSLQITKKQITAQFTGVFADNKTVFNGANQMAGYKVIDSQSQELAAQELSFVYNNEDINYNNQPVMVYVEE